MTKCFQIGLFIRIGLLFGALIALSAIFWKEDYFFSQLILATTTILLMAELIRYNRWIANDLKRFLQAMHHRDYGYRKGDRHFPGLAEEMKKLLKEQESLRIEKEQNYLLLSRLTDHLKSGLLVCDADGSIFIINEYLRRQFDLPQLGKLGDLGRFVPKLAEHISGLGGSPGEELITISFKGESLSLLVLADKFQLDNKRYYSYLIENRSKWEEDHEMQSWLKLIRILTHEIMNSITSISSLSETVLHLHQQKDDSNQDKIEKAMSTIIRRNKSLMSFVDDYRQLTHVPRPEFKWVDLNELTQEQLRLMEANLDGTEVQFNSSAVHKCRIDPGLTGQVIQNLLFNALHAMEEEESPRIEISLREGSQYIEWSIYDNGKGIKPVHLNEIFVPFFSTKESGSGIGLSLSRQIMRSQGGRIYVESEEGKGACFRLRFYVN